MMKNWLFAIIALFVVVLAACSSSNEEKDTANSGVGSDTITYTTSKGEEIEVPKDPKRVVVLYGFVGTLKTFGVPTVGADAWSMQNPEFDEYLKDAIEVSNEEIEKIVELEPDLILGLDTVENADKLKEIAPTVLFKYGEYSYLDQIVEVGKVINKEQEAKDWVADFEKRAVETGKEIKAKIGADATVSVIENFNKQIYVYGENWGRGTELLYQAMELEMPAKVKETALEPGYYALSSEVIADFAGDYLIVSKFEEQDNSFMDTAAFKNIPAVKDGKMIVVDANRFYFNDAYTLDYQLNVFRKAFLE